MILDYLVSLGVFQGCVILWKILGIPGISSIG